MSNWKRVIIEMEVDVRFATNTDSNYDISIHKEDMEDWKEKRNGMVLRNVKNHNDMWYMQTSFEKSVRTIEDKEKYRILSGKSVA